MGRFAAQCEYVVWGSLGAMTNRGIGCLPDVFARRINPSEKQHVIGKPVALMRDLLQITKAGDIVFDPFMGSGSTSVAALEAGRKFIGSELSSEYFDIARTLLETVKKTK